MPLGQDCSRMRGSSSPAWLLPLALLLSAVVGVPLRILEDEGLPRYRLLKHELTEIDAENEALTREVKRLARDVEALRTDPEQLERIARDELGMVKADELIFQF